MRIFSARPLALACFAAMMGAVVAFFLPTIVKIILLALLVIPAVGYLTVFFVRGKKLSDTRHVLTLTAMLVCSLSTLTVLQSLCHFDLSARLPREIVDSDQTSTVQCIILEENGAGSGYSFYTVRVERIREIPVHFRAMLECRYTASYHTGDVIEAELTAHSLADYCDRDDILYAIADGSRYALIGEEEAGAKILRTRSLPLRQLAARWRANLSARLSDLVGKRSGGLAIALFLGDRNSLDESVSTYFRRAGVSHLLALSGMHVSLLLGLIASLATALRIPKKGRLLLLFLLAAGYLVLIGFRISAVRAVGMLLIFYLAEWVGSRHDPLTTLCLVGFLMLTVSPATVADGGFWMSFSAVFGLVTVSQKFNVWLNSKPIPHIIKAPMQGISASAIAVVSVSFLSWLFCGEISPIGILMTALLTPLLTLILFLIPFALLLDLLPIFSAAPLAFPLSLALDCMIRLTDQVAHLRHVSFSLAFPLAGVFLAVMTLLLLVLLIVRLRHKFLLILPPVMAAAALAIGIVSWNHTLYRSQLTADYAVRGSGSALVVSDRDGTVVIDTSAGSHSMMKDAETAALSHGATEIEHLILTHYQRSFVYSTERFAKRQIIRFVWLPQPQTEEEYLHLSALRDRLSPLGVEVRCYADGESLSLLQNLVFSRSGVAFIDRSSRPIITYTLQTPQELLMFSTPSALESNAYSTFRCLSEQTDILILGKYGPVIKPPYDDPIPLSSHRLILADSAELLACLDLSDTDAISEGTLIADIGCYPFAIRK